METHLTNISAIHQEMFQSVLNSLINEHNAIAVIGFGSYFEDGGSHFTADGLQGSDIDLIVLSDTPKFELIILNRGHRFEIRHFNQGKFRAMLSRSNVCFVPEMSRGTVLYDPTGVAVDFQTFARSIYERGHPEFGRDRTIKKKFISLHSTLGTLAFNLENAPKFHVCFSDALRKLYSIKCTQANVWERSNKNMLRHLASIDADLHNLIDDCYRSNNLSFMFNTLEQAFNKAVHEYGDLDLRADSVL